MTADVVVRSNSWDRFVEKMVHKPQSKMRYGLTLGSGRSENVIFMEDIGVAQISGARFPGEFLVFYWIQQ